MSAPFPILPLPASKALSPPVTSRHSGVAE